MKKRIFSFTALLLTFVMLILSAGCGVRINGKDYEFFTSKPDKNNNILGGIGSEISNTQEFSGDNEKSEKLKVSIGAGNITIKKAGGSKIEVKADKKVRGASGDTKKEIIDNMIVSLDEDGNTIEIKVKTKDGKDFWTWKRNNHMTYQVSLNLDVELPDSIKEINTDTGAGNVNIKELDANITTHTGAGNITVGNVDGDIATDTGAGNIDIDESSGKITAATGAGNIDIDDAAVTGSSKLNSGAGNVNFDGKIDELSSFNISTGMGNVDFKVPENSKMSLEVDTGVGNLSGSFIHKDDNNKSHYKGDINGGGPSVKLNTGVGNISAGAK